MTASELKYNVEMAGHERYFFDKKTMRFFGDRMSNYGVCETVIEDLRNEKIPVYELYRKRPVNHGLNASAYFDKQTFKRVFAKRD